MNEKDLESIHSMRIYWCWHLNHCPFATSCLEKWHSGTKVPSCDTIHLSFDCSSADRQAFSIQYCAVFQYQLLFVPGQQLQQIGRGPALPQWPHPHVEGGKLEIKRSFICSEHRYLCHEWYCPNLKTKVRDVICLKGLLLSYNNH